MICQAPDRAACPQAALAAVPAARRACGARKKQTIDPAPNDRSSHGAPRGGKGAAPECQIDPFWSATRDVIGRPPECAYRRIPRAMSDQDRQHSVTNADLRRAARSPCRIRAL